jgi:37-kD nucleoid-associated bacterial protein
MISSRDLAQVTIRHIIFHDVPTIVRGQTLKPTLVDTITPLDAQRSAMLKTRLTRVIGSTAAYAVEFASGTASPVPAELRAITTSTSRVLPFVAMSQKLAQYLFQLQVGSVSPGLLCVIDIATGGRNTVAILKLERERGAELHLKTQRNGQRAFAMSILDNLVLTDSTRLFKAAMFIRSGRDTFRSAVCEGQRNVGTSNEVAHFWMRFLGCQFVEEPRIATQRWFDATVQFVNDVVTDAVVKNDIYEHLMSELKSTRATVSPKKFIEAYLPEAYGASYKAFLDERRVSLTTFEKDNSDIENRLRRRSLHTSRGVTVSMPVAEASLVEVEAEQIVVHDQLRSIAQK